MPKFILIDQSIRKFGGHHYEYAVHVLKAAEKAGYQTALATNRDFTNEGDGGWAIYPSYEFDFWGVSRKLRGGQRRLRRWKQAAKRVMVRVKLSVAYSWLGLLISARNRPDTLLSLLQGDGAVVSPMLVVALIPAVYVAVVARALWRWLRTILSLIWHSWLGVILRASLQVVSALLFPFRAVRRYARHLVDWRWRRVRATAFSRDTLRLLRSLHLEAGDVVFIPTLSEIDLQGLQRCFSADASTLKPTWHLLFRRNIYVGREPNYGDQEQNLQYLRGIFQAFRETTPRHRVNFYTDTEQLTAQWNRLHAGSFETLPIPVNGRLTTKTSTAGVGPITISYVGDARSEKGYQYIPAVVSRLWPDYVMSGKARFVLQSNFAFHTYESQASVVVARQLMERMDPNGVNLLKEPLDSEAYCDLILQSDIGLLLYDRDNYYARSSGALVEYLTAGIPIIVPSGSWLSTQIEGEVYKHQRFLRDSLPKALTLRGEEVGWRLIGQDEALSACVDGTVTFGGHLARTFAWLDVPEGATHIAVSFKTSRLTEEAQPGTYVNLHLEILDEYEVSVGKSVGILGYDAEGCLFMARLPANASRLWLGLHNAYYDSPMTLVDTRVDFLVSTSNVPLGAVGRVVATMDEVADCLREMIDHYAHYRSTACDFVHLWVERHNPDELVRRIMVNSSLQTTTQGGNQ